MTLETTIQNLVGLGLTHRQARFLVIVMQQSGVCVPRQYAAFVGTVYGQRMNRFFDRLVPQRLPGRATAFTTGRGSSTCSTARSTRRLANRTAGSGGRCPRAGSWSG